MADWEGGGGGILTPMLLLGNLDVQLSCVIDFYKTLSILNYIF